MMLQEEVTRLGDLVGVDVSWFLTGHWSINVKHTMSQIVRGITYRFNLFHFDQCTIRMNLCSRSSITHHHASQIQFDRVTEHSLPWTLLSSTTSRFDPTVEFNKLLLFSSLSSLTTIATIALLIFHLWLIFCPM